MLKVAALLSYIKPSYVRYAYMNGKRYHASFFSEIDQFLAVNEIQLDEKIFKRIAKYLMNTQVVYLWFSTLRGKKLTTQEELTTLYLSGFIPLYDDLNDEHGLKHKDILAILQKDNSVLTPEQMLFKFFYEKLVQHFANQSLFNFYLEKAGASQNESLYQKTDNLTFKELMKITTDKGGYSLLLLRSALKPDVVQEEKQAVFLLGQLIQLLDDLFDVYKDTQAGVTTIPNTTQDIKLLRKLMVEQFHITTEAFQQLGYSSKNKQKFKQQLTFFISAGMVCLDRYELLQKGSNGVFNAKGYSRDELLFDMEKLGSIFNCVRYTWRGI